MYRFKLDEPIPPKIIGGILARIIRFLIRINIILVALRTYRDPITACKLMAAIISKKKQVHGKTTNLKFIRSDKRYFWSISSTGWPSRAFDRFILSEFHKIKPVSVQVANLQTIIFSITNRCPLKCEHCYEWNNLSAKELLSLSELLKILHKFQEYGVSNIQFSGGEPLNRFGDLIELIKAVKPETDTWILTSGYELTLEKAFLLKKAGLNGVVISLDHWEEGEHNRFRKNSSSFFWVKEAINNSIKADLVTAISLCATKEFTSMENLEKYLDFAQQEGVGLIRILEPRKVGHFSGKNIELEEEQIDILTRFYLKGHSDPVFKDKPLVLYPGYHQRRAGCFGAGNRYLYVDSKGDLHACPFCQNKIGNALTDPLAPLIVEMKQVGCHKFESNSEVRYT